METGVQPSKHSHREGAADAKMGAVPRLPVHQPAQAQRVLILISLLWLYLQCGHVQSSEGYAESCRVCLSVVKGALSVRVISGVDRRIRNVLADRLCGRDLQCGHTAGLINVQIVRTAWRLGPSPSSWRASHRVLTPSGKPSCFRAHHTH